MDAYLDIETTGLSPYKHDITLIGIGRAIGDSMEFVQLFESTLTSHALAKALKGVARLFTYNGDRFDLPFIKEHLRLDIAEGLAHHDLMFDCWDLGLYGGLKVVEQALGIPRKHVEIDGKEAVRLWWRYRNDNDHGALTTLVEYNREDVANLAALRKKLYEICRSAELAIFE